jgi:putative transposase
LRKKTDAYYQERQRLSYKDLSEALTDLKKQSDYSWLKEVSSVPLQQSLRHLEKAFLNFFEGRAEYPTFKKRHHQQSATYMNNAFRWDGTGLTLARMDAPLDIVWSRSLPGDMKPSSITITKDGANRYFVSFLIEEDIAHLPTTSTTIGADLGLKSFIVLSDGQVVGNPQFLQKDEKKLAKAQRRHAKKKKGSKNREKARKKVAKIYARITDRLGVSLCPSFRTKPCGTDGRSSRSTSGIRPPNAALIVGICSTPYRLMYDHGHALNVGLYMIVISMLRRIYMPWDSRYLKPAERR